LTNEVHYAAGLSKHKVVPLLQNGRLLLT
jgi:hypothetical protein